MRGSDVEYTQNWVLVGCDGSLACNNAIPGCVFAFTKHEFAEYVREVARQRDFVVVQTSAVRLREIVRETPTITGVSIVFDMGAEEVTAGKRGRPMAVVSLPRKQFLEGG